MLISCWSAKGGVGTTVVAIGLASVLSHTHGSALLVDLAGDLPAALGVPEPPGPGLGGWLAAGPSVPPDAMLRLEVQVGNGLSLVPRGCGPLAGEGRASTLAALLAADSRPVVVDCGQLPGCGPGDGTGSPPGGDVAAALAAAASRSVLVTRACFLALRRASNAPLRPSEVVLIAEPGRALDVRDVTEIVGAPVRSRVPFDPAVSRAVDAGLLASRLPRSLARALAAAA